MTVKPKLFRDPVHDTIALLDGPAERLVLALMDTPEVQRLRRIRQLGLTSMVYPGAEHSRFQHSLGVLWTAHEMLARIAMRRGNLDAALAEGREAGNDFLLASIHLMRDEPRDALPLLSKPEHYTTLKYGRARGHEPVRYVDSIRSYYSLLTQLEPEAQPSRGQ